MNTEIPIAHDGRPATVPLTVNADEAARLCGVSRSLWFKMLAQELVPEPIRLGRRVLWRVGELDAWLTAGCPTAAKWRKQREARP